MPRKTPAIFADEITASAGPWMISNARLRPTPRENASFGASITIDGRDVWSDVYLWGAPKVAQAAAAALKRSGYEIHGLRSNSSLARRRLHGSRELDVEVCRLEALAADAGSLASFPPRRPRPARLSTANGRFPTMLLQRLQLHGWSLEWVSVQRKGEPAFVCLPGWTAGAWCSVLDDGDDRRLDIHVQVFSKPSSKDVDSDELARLIRAVRSQLGPLGYKTAKINWSGTPPQCAFFEKGLRTLAAARRERSVLDRALFGD